jgi:biopolymer transport protein ExbD
MPTSCQAGPPQEENKKRPKKENVFLKDKSDLSMTPMIDVTFLLLIFFMVACKFKTFEAKLNAYMPRHGRDNFDVTQPAVPIDLKLRWNAPRRQCRVTVGQVFCGYDTEGMHKAQRLVRRLKSSGMERAQIDAGGDVRSGWVVSALNILVKAGLSEIDFTGHPIPLPQ